MKEKFGAIRHFGRDSLIDSRGEQLLFQSVAPARNFDFVHFCSFLLKGVVPKWRDSLYRDADHETACMKIKNNNYTGAVGRHELCERNKLPCFDEEARELRLQLIMPPLRFSPSRLHASSIHV
jgi:hypothetical protein